jgi:stress-induced morphogen
MPILKQDLLKLLQDGFPQGEIDVVDLAGDNDHYEAIVKSPTFQGKSKLEQHKMVYSALGDKVGGQIHALSVKTFIK